MNLELAIQIASDAHLGQLDKAGEPYILHPLRVMLKFKSENERIVAILHDVVEDSSYTLDDLRSKGFSEDIVDAISCLTKTDNESYEEFIQRVSKNKLATKIKIADLKDNLDVTRINSLEKKDLDRVAKYHKALQILAS